MRRLAKETRPQWTTMHLCRWRGRFHKPTTICAAGPGAGITHSYNVTRCVTAQHTLSVLGTDADGNPLSRQAGEYPVAMCAWTAACWLRQDALPPQSICSSGQVLAAFVEHIERNEDLVADSGALGRLR